MLLTALVFLVGAVDGCVAGSGANAPSTSSLKVWYATDDPIERAWSQQLAKLFERSHPDVNVSMAHYSLGDFNPKMQLALTSGNPPDLAYATPRACGIPIYVQAGKLLNLTKYARAYRWPSRLRPNLLSEYNSPFTLYKTQSAASFAGNVQVYAVPHAKAAVGLMYNQKLLARLHISAPRTMAQFQHALGVAKQAHLIPLGMGNADAWLGDDWYLSLVNTYYSYQYLERELRLDPRFKFNQPGFYAAGKTLQEWAKAGYFTPNFGGLDAQEGVDAFFKGKTVFQLVSSSENAQILADQRQTGVPVGIVAFPSRTVPYTGVMATMGYEGWVVPKGSKNKTAAIQFINFMLKPSTTRFLVKQAVLPSVPVSPVLASTSWQRSYLKALQTARRGVYIDAAPVPNLNSTMEANVTLLLQSIEGASFLPTALQTVYTSHGKHGASNYQSDCEF
jgi:raffinose/stachyose/melibiose transport system substrate-binding protein